MREARRLAGLVLAGATLVAPSLASPDRAHGRTLTAVTKSGKRMPGPYQRWIDRALVPTVRGRVHILLTGCPRRPRFAGCVYSRRLHTIYMKRRVRQRRQVLYHELGHLFDFRLLSHAERRAYKRLVGQPRRGWFGGVNPPSEQFAEAYALCARRHRIAAHGPRQLPLPDHATTPRHGMRADPPRRRAGRSAAAAQAAPGGQRPAARHRAAA